MINGKLSHYGGRSSAYFRDGDLPKQTNIVMRNMMIDVEKLVDGLGYSFLNSISNLTTSQLHQKVM